MFKVLVPAVLAVLALLAVTNPSEEAHGRAVVAHAKKSCGDSGVARVLCGGIASLASAGIAYDDHLLFSTGRIGETKTVGVLGKVFVVSE